MLRLYGIAEHGQCLIRMRSDHDVIKPFHKPVGGTYHHA